MDNNLAYSIDYYFKKIFYCLIYLKYFSDWILLKNSMLSKKEIFGIIVSLVLQLNASPWNQKGRYADGYDVGALQVFYTF